MPTKKNALGFKPLSNASRELSASTPLHITICASMSGNLDEGQYNLESEMQMVKAAMLYADQVELCSVAAHNVLACKELSHASWEEIFRRTSHAAMSPSEREEWNRLEKSIQRIESLKMNRKHLSKELRSELELGLAKEHFVREFTINYPIFAQKIALQDQGLAAALDSGIVKVHRFDPKYDFFTLWNDHGIDGLVALMGEYLEEANNALIQGKTYPLIDTTTGSMLSDLHKNTGVEIDEVSSSSSKEVALAANLMERLPNFERAKVDEIIDIRRDLARPLIGFRAAMIGFQAEIKSASWDKNFEREADRLFRQKIEPVILEIDEATQNNRYYKDLLGSPELPWKNIALVPTVATIATVISQMNPYVLAGAATVTAASVIGNLLSAKNKENERARAIEGNQLHFYYDAYQRLRD